MTEEEIKLLKDENAALKGEVERLKDELVRMVSRNLDLSERLEYDVELRRRTEVAREIMEGNIERQRNADLRDDGQLMALIEMKVEKDRPHLNRPDWLSCSVIRPFTARPMRISTTCVRWLPCACCAKSLTTPLR